MQVDQNYTDATFENGSLSCPSASFCMAGDELGNVLTFNGTSWSQPDEATGSYMYIAGLSCSTSSFCAAVGGGATIYNGSTWSAAQNIDPGNVLTGVSCASATFCVAIDNHGQTMTYNGASWSAPASANSPNTNQLTSVSCVSSAFCAATQRNSNQMLTFNGTAWSAHSTSSDPPFDAVSCTSTTSCIAIGSQGTLWLGTAVAGRRRRTSAAA